MKRILGIDVGGTKIASALVEDGVKLQNVKIVPTSQTEFIHQLIDLIKRENNFEAIGLAVPGPVLSDGTVTRLPNVGSFQRTNLKNLLEERFKTPVAVVNDAKAFALAEAKVGQAQNNKVVAGITLGTGIGAGIVIDQKIYFGKDGVSGEFEHVRMLDGKLFREHKRTAGRFKNAKDATVYLRTLLDMVVLSFNPDVIILGGAWSDLPGMEDLVNELTINVGEFENKTPVKLSKLHYPSIVGASLLAQESL